MAMCGNTRGNTRGNKEISELGHTSIICNNSSNENNTEVDCDVYDALMANQITTTIMMHNSSTNDPANEITLLQLKNTRA